MNYLSKAVGVGIVAGIVAVGAGSAQADTFSACFKNTTQKVRPGSILLNATPVCKSTETLRSWNEQGPAGPAGPSGTASCVVEQFTGTNPPGTFSVLNPTCSSGTAMSASFLWHTPFDGADNDSSYYFFPRGGGTITLVSYQYTATAQDYYVYLICCS